jgi:TrmH family RNA methyltransferase
MRRISSRKNPIAEHFRIARAPGSMGEVMLVDGLHLVREARAAGCAVFALAINELLYEKDAEAAALANELDAAGRTEVFVVTDPVLAAISPTKNPSGIVAIVGRPLRNLRTLLENDSRPFVVVAVDVQDPGNVGAVIRAAEALGATAVLVSGASANPFGWKALRGSMGSTLRLPVESIAHMSATELMSCARGLGFRTIAAVPQGGQPPEGLEWKGRVALFIGGEGPGLPDLIINGCDARVTIPMAAPVESLNVAAATALILYEARRQRGSEINKR